MFQKIVFVVLCVIVLAGCAASPTASLQPETLTGKLAYETAPQFTDAELQELVSSQNAFANAIFAYQAQAKENLVISPYSLYQILSMLYAGAAGETASEMRQTLRLPWEDADAHRVINALNQRLFSTKSTESGVGQAFELKMANALWADRNREYEQAFLDTLTRNYAAGLKTLDFSNGSAASDVINAWVAEQTANKITQIAEPSMFSENTALALTNAVYFKAAWMHPFYESATSPAPFTLLSGEQKEVPTMLLEASLPLRVTDELTAVRLPYANGDMVMEILMPNLDAWENADALSRLGAYQESLGDLEATTVLLSLPKFRIETPTMDLIPALKENGMRLAFSGEADFSGISGDQSLYVSTAAQKAFIDVNEQGTEAAAVSIVVMEEKGVPQEPLKVNIDRPFLFQIRDTATGAILFLGMVAEP